MLRQLLQVDVRARRHGLLRWMKTCLGRLASAPAAAGARGEVRNRCISTYSATLVTRPCKPDQRCAEDDRARRIHACYLRSHTDAPLFRGAAHRFKRGGWGRLCERRQQGIPTVQPACREKRVATRFFRGTEFVCLHPKMHVELRKCIFSFASIS